MKLNEKRIVNDIRLLALDMIREASSGNAGVSLSAAPALYTLFAYHLKFDLERKTWCNRDRFVLSSAGASPLLYATLFYLLEEYNIDELRQYKRLSSQVPGYAEYDLNHRIETTTGPYGQGLATAVGMAIGEKFLSSTFNRKKNTVFDYNIYTLCTEEDLMEGVSFEASSLAGHLGLDNLIVLYDANGVTGDGPIGKVSSEDVTGRYSSLGWEVINVKNGESIGDISSAIDKAKKSKKPALIKINTTFGKYSKYAGTNKLYSSISEDDLENIRNEFKGGDAFTYSEVDREAILKFISSGVSDYYRQWYSEYEMYIANATDSEKDAINLVIEGEGISLDIDAVVDSSKIFEDKAMRDINYQIMNVIATFIPNFLGGSTDLFCNTKAYLKGKDELTIDNYGARNINFGRREAALPGILNGLALTNIRCYGSTILARANEMKAGMRMSSMMNLPVTYIFTHDSIRGVSDGPVNQPVEELSLLRSIPNFSVYRPCDYKELIGAWSNILKEGKPAALVLPKGHNDTMKYTAPSKVVRGAYIISEVKTRLDLIIIATGSEVELAMKIKEELLKNYIEARVVSMPNMNLFLKQDKDYQEQVLPTGYRRMVIELSNDANWYRFISSEEDLIGIQKFGMSAPEEDILNYLELDISSLVIKIKNNL